MLCKVCLFRSYIDPHGQLPQFQKKGSDKRRMTNNSAGGLAQTCFNSIRPRLVRLELQILGRYLWMHYPSDLPHTLSADYSTLIITKLGPS